MGLRHPVQQHVAFTFTHHTFDVTENFQIALGIFCCFCLLIETTHVYLYNSYQKQRDMAVREVSYTYICIYMCTKRCGKQDMQLSYVKKNICNPFYTHHSAFYVYILCQRTLLSHVKMNMNWPTPSHVAMRKVLNIEFFSRKTVPHKHGCFPRKTSRFLKPPDPISHVCSLTGEQICRKYFTSRSVQIFKIVFRRFWFSRIWSSTQDHALLVKLLNLVGFFISTWQNLSGGNDLYWRCTSFEKAFRRGRPLNILHDS